MKITMVSIIVNDPLKAYAFYTETLGFVRRMFVPDARLAIVTAPEDPDGTGLLLEPNDHPASKAFQQTMYSEGFPVMVFSVTDIHETYARLKEKGVAFRKEPTQAEWGGYEAILDDTCGNLLLITQT